MPDVNQRVFIAFLGVLFAATANADEGRVALSYDLQPGDHIVYAETVERQGQRKGLDFALRSTVENHLVVVSGQGGWSVVGVQRNVGGMELLRYVEKGKDRTEQERADFARREAERPKRFAEVNRVNAFGQARLAWSAVRETPSEKVLGVREIEALPAQPVAVGDSWEGANPLGLRFRADGWEELSGERCLKVTGTSPFGGVTLRYWYSPSRRLLARVELDAAYPGFEIERKDHFVLKLRSVTRGEKLDDWLHLPVVQLATLDACGFLDPVPVAPGLIDELLASGDSTLHRRVLGLVYRRFLPAPTLERLSALAVSDDPVLRRLSIRALERVRTADALPLVERALTDGDEFVVDAALAWLRARLPEAERLRLKRPAEANDLKAALASTIVPRPSSLAAVEEQVQLGKPTPQWDCQAPGWSERVTFEKRRPIAASGTTARGLISERNRGVPFLLHVPEDYRGDQPFPLLVFLGGGPGLAWYGVYKTPVFAKTGYLIAFPHARGGWFTPESEQLVQDLIVELERGFNVDPDRIYIGGSSNGASAAYLYAAHYPHRFAAAVSLMGAGVRSPVVGDLPDAENLAHVPMLFVHGQKDETINAKASVETVDRLKKGWRVAPVRLELLKDKGHELDLHADEGLTFPFLREQRRDPFPRMLRFATADLAFPRHYWLEVVDKERGLASVAGEIAPDNTITLTTKKVRALRLLLRRELLTGNGPIRVVVNGAKVAEQPLTEDCQLIERSWAEGADPYLAYSMALDVVIPK